MQYRGEIDGLRAVAVLPVILFHAGYRHFGGGFVGVDVFFVISGYLITTIIISELDTGKFSLVQFYERRARRILPALFLVLSATIPLAWIWLQPSDMLQFSQSLIAVSLFSSNILFWRQSGYFDTAAELKPLLHTWSLAVEEQYYVVFPLILMLLWPTFQRWLVGVLAALMLLSLGAAHWGSVSAPTGTFFLLPTRGWELLVGSFCAYYLYKGRTSIPSAPAQQFLSITGLVLIFFSIFAYSKRTPFPSLYALAPTIGTALVIVYSNGSNAVGALLRCKPLVGIGLISYSAYLWHQPLLSFARHSQIEPPSHFSLAALLALTVVLSYLTWRFVEMPARQRERGTTRQVFTIAVACSLTFIAFGITGHATKGFTRTRMNIDQEKVLATALPSPMRDECHTQGLNYRKPALACEYHFRGSNWAILGDSHGVELAYALADLLKHSGEGVKHFTFSACPPSYRRKSMTAGCSEWTDETVRYIASDSTIRYVVVSYRIHWALFGGHEDDYPRLPSTVHVSERNAVWEAYKQLLKRLIAGNKKVILVLQAPELPKRIQSLVWRERTPNQIIGVDVNWWNARSSFLRDRIAEIPNQVMIIDPTTLFCDARYCYAVQDGQALYFDDDHMSLAGASLVARQVLQRVIDRESVTATLPPMSEHLRPDPRD